MTTDKSLTAIILAGGQSSRMGQDKALLDIQGVPLLQRTCQVAQGCADPVYIVTAWSDRYQVVVPPSCQFIQETLTGTNPPQGPLSGFAQALPRVQTTWTLLLACDLPLLSLEELQTGIVALESIPKDAIALLPRSEQGWEPLCGFYHRRCLSLLTAFVDQGGRSFQQWLADQVVEEWLISDRRMLFNCNTPNDLQLLRVTN